MRSATTLGLTWFLFAAVGAAQTNLSSLTRGFVKVDAPVVALEHVRVIDGTGAAPREDQTVILEHGRISIIGNAASTAIPSGAQVLDLAGRTVIPGIVGMHDHLFYPNGARGAGYLANDLGFTAPRLYLACGVTTIRTTGSIEPYTDMSLKRGIDAGEIPGPKIHLTAPYLQGKGSPLPMMYELRDADDARRFVNFYADQGFTSFKAYTEITRAELAAAVEEAHKRGLKVTGHLCSVTFREAAELGIDNLEHGLAVDTDFVKDKQPDLCPSGKAVSESIANLDMQSAPTQETIRMLVKKNVAVTSTLAIFESFVPGRPPIQKRVTDALLPQALTDYLLARERMAARPRDAEVDFKKEKEFELAFSKAGGLLLAGVDPTGAGGVLPGFGNQRELELLVESGFTPLEAIQIATSNGAKFMGESDRIGSLVAGKQADLVVLRGDPSKNISDIENVELVFKDGVGNDSAKLVDSVRGEVGLH
jgi:imidazolonepropionase-like amidohydrolase